MTTQTSELVDTHLEEQKKTWELPAWFPWFMGRLLSGLMVVFVISLIVFIATQALPSDPARVILGPEAPEATVEILREQLGLNQPILIQYWSWVSQFVQGNFGQSIDSHVPVKSIIQNFFANTLFLSVLVIVVTVPISVVTGVWLALRRDSKLDRFIVSSSIVFKAVPGFVLAIWLMMFFSISVFQILPAAS
ncbi:MAG: ABC transporter permease, partial [Acinetobacter sp.]